MKVIITGATGMVGSEAVRQAIRNKDIAQITVIVRKPLPFDHPKIKTVLHQNFLDYEGLGQLFRENDACLWCLGISQTAVSKQQYFRITYGFTMAAAHAMVQANPSMIFLFVSGEGADAAERSRIRFARVKGKTENALRRLAFKKLIIVRPGGIKPMVRDERNSFYKKLELFAINIMEWLTPNKVITSGHLARVMLYLVQNPTDRIIFENKLLKMISPPAT